MQRYFFEYQGVKLHFLFFKGGDKVMLAFHGYGQDASVYKGIADAIKEEYSVYAIDLFFHGRSTWPFKEKAIDKNFFQDLMKAFLEKYNIGIFAVAGYSLGAKSALVLAEFFPDSIEKVFLLAPDGVKKSFWYNISTQPGIVRNLFRYIVFKPFLFYKLAHTLFALRIINNATYRFANSQMNTRNKRGKVYYSWVVYRLLKPDLELITNLIQTNRFPAKLYLGKYDVIFSENKMRFFTTKASRMEVKILPCGHSKVIEFAEKIFLA